MGGVVSISLDDLIDCKVCIGSEFAVQCHHCGFEECQLTCGTCMDSGGNVSQPAPLTVPAGGCLIQTTGTTMECRPDSERTCGADGPPPPPSVLGHLGCEICPDSDFVGSCNGCYVDGCQLTCNSCRDSDGNFAAPAPFIVPAGGCVVQNSNTQLRCTPYTVGACPSGNTTYRIPQQHQEPIGWPKWKIGAATVGGLLALLLTAALALLLLRHRKQKQLLPLQRDSTKSTSSLMDPADAPGSSTSMQDLASVASKEPLYTRLASAFQSMLVALHFRQSPVDAHYVLESGSGSRSELQLSLGAESRASSRLVHASIIDLDEIEICKMASGEDWLLGMGSYGRVYKAKMGNLEVAVKTIQKQHVNPQLTSQQALQVMQQELKILQTLPFDKNVVQFHGSCAQDGDILLVLEYMQGGDLRQALRGPSAPALSWYNKGAQVALDVMQGLNFLHCHGILHRDIKSGNVLLSEDFSSAKICDVGLAHIMGSTSLSSTSSNVQTTLAYAAPEMLLCLRCDEKADIFSYGVVLWELITQEHARRGQLRDLRVPEDCPQAISDLVSACLHQQAANRPDALQIIQILQTSIANNSQIDV